MRVAGIDCGTNSIRLLIADTSEAGLVDVVREMRVVRLGQDVDRTGRLAPEALERTRVALADYAATIRAYDAARVRMVATSATRDAANRDEFYAMVRGELGVDPEVITGAEEAGLSFIGAVSALSAVAGPHRSVAGASRLLVADIGGGSTELVLGDLAGPGPSSSPSALRSHSMNVGCVRMAERHLHDDPPTADQVAAIVADVNAAIDQAAVDVPLDTDATFVGVAGTVTTIAAIALDLDEYDAEVIHGAVISADQVRQVTGRLLRMTHDERAAIAVMHPGRVDVIGAGALVLRTLVDRIGAAQVVASEHDILDGIALSLTK